MRAETIQRAFSIIVLTAVVASCAYQDRTSSQQLSDSAVVNAYNTLMGGGASATGSTGTTGTTTSGSGLFNQDPQATIFFVQTDGSRPITSVLAMDDMSVLSSAWDQGEPIYDTIEVSAQIFFVVALTTDGNGNTQNAYELDIGLTDNQGNAQTLTWTSVPGSDSFSSNGFSVQMTGSDGNTNPIILSSSDVTNGSFNSAIKLIIQDQNGDPAAGQISTMAGYF